MLGQAYRPSDEYEGRIEQTTVFRIVADYGHEETAQKEAQAVVYTSSQPVVPNGHDQPGIFTIKPEQFDLAGSPNSVFSGLSDRVHDRRVKAISTLEIAVESGNRLPQANHSATAAGEIPTPN